VSIHSSSCRTGVGRPTLALGIALALVIGLAAPIAVSPRSAAAAEAVTTTDLNLRAGPGLDRHVKLVMPPGAPVDLLSGLGRLGFYKVAYRGETGYAWGEFVAVGGGAIRDTAAAANAFATDALNFRAGPGTDNRILDVIPRGGAVTLLGDSRNGFASAVYADEQGWVAEDFLESTRGDRDDGSDNDPVSDDGDVAYTTTDLNLRSRPSVASRVVTVMPPAVEVTLTGSEEDGFAGVRYGDERGWASTEYLSSSAPEAPDLAGAPGGGRRHRQHHIRGGGGLRAERRRPAGGRPCESGLDPGAYNASSAASGLFQFLPGTWATTPYAASSIFDPTANANAAAWMWSVGRRGEWVC
jgi:uncharacterized protein YraI